MAMSNILNLFFLFWIVSVGVIRCDENRDKSGESGDSDSSDSNSGENSAEGSVVGSSEPPALGSNDDNQSVCTEEYDPWCACRIPGDCDEYSNYCLFSVSEKNYELLSQGKCDPNSTTTTASPLDSSSQSSTDVPNSSPLVDPIPSDDPSVGLPTEGPITVLPPDVSVSSESSPLPGDSESSPDVVVPLPGRPPIGLPRPPIGRPPFWGPPRPGRPPVASVE